MKRILHAIFFTLFMCLIPKLVSAAPCNPSHTFITGEVLTAAILNSNPVTFSGCLNNVDNTNVGSAGLYASQIKPTNSSQATFGNSIPYVFQGGLASLSTVNTTGEYYQTESGFTFHQFIDSSGHIGWYNATSAFTLPTYIDLATGNVNTAALSSTTGSFSGNVSLGTGGTGEIHQTEAGFTANYYLDSGDHLGFYDATHSHDSGILLGLNSGTLQQAVGGTATQYLPTFVNGSAVTAQNNAHVEYIKAAGSGTFNFTKAFDAAPICTSAAVTSTTTTQYTTSGAANFSCGGS